jgi:uncharacterized protein YndB with AHSA1/START domain
MMTTATPPDVIEKEIVLRAPRSRVWRALTDAREFGSWFRAEIDGAFAPGRTARGRILHPGYEHLTFEMVIVQMEPESLFSFRWHPYAIDPDHDYSQEPRTLVVFELAEAAEGTRIRLTESGFDQIPLSRRAEAYRMNSQGWGTQLDNIARHVEQPR